MVKIAEPMTDVGIRYIEDRKHYFQDWGTIEQLIARIRSLKSDLSTLKPEGEQISATCEKCGGEGTLYTSKYGGNDPDVWPIGKCDDCEGSGEVELEADMERDLSSDELDLHMQSDESPLGVSLNELRIKAFKSNSATDRQTYYDALSATFQNGMLVSSEAVLRALLKEGE